MIELGIMAVLFIVASIIFGICATGNDIIDRNIDKDKKHISKKRVAGKSITYPACKEEK